MQLVPLATSTSGPPLPSPMATDMVPPPKTSTHDSGKPLSLSNLPAEVALHILKEVHHDVRIHPTRLVGSQARRNAIRSFEAPMLLNKAWRGLASTSMVEHTLAVVGDMRGFRRFVRKAEPSYQVRVRSIELTGLGDLTNLATYLTQLPQLQRIVVRVNCGRLLKASSCLDPAFNRVVFWKTWSTAQWRVARIRQVMTKNQRARLRIEIHGIHLQWASPPAAPLQHIYLARLCEGEKTWYLAEKRLL